MASRAVHKPDQALRRALMRQHLESAEASALAVITSLIQTLGNHRLRRRRVFPPTLTNVQY